MAYKWIDLSELKALDNNVNIILFGAGKASEEFIQFIQENNFKTDIVAITDNDKSMWGRKFYEYEIISPNNLDNEKFDKIVVTSISGREAISSQLTKMGFKIEKDFLLIGKYPKSYLNNLISYLNDTKDFFPQKKDNFLNIGSGGFLGFEVCLFCLGFNRVHAIDKYSFGINYPDVTKYKNEYLEIQKHLPRFVLPNETEKFLQRFQQVFIQKQERLYLDENYISYTKPIDVCNLEFDNNSFDVVTSFAVLEHVKDPERAIFEISRVLKTNGITIHRIITQDHRCFSAVSGYEPYSFRKYAPEQWKNISNDKFYQNRLLPVEWVRLFEKNNLKINKFKVHKNISLSDEKIKSFDSSFDSFTKDEHSEFDCTIVAQKR